MILQIFKPFRVIVRGQGVDELI
ncbi:MAG: hypothetical protein H6Q96_423, partial [Nitrospirae bacterium]|nr:hypothetical protein [Nitrospirota bacterium]